MNLGYTPEPTLSENLSDMWVDFSLGRVKPPEPEPEPEEIPIVAPARNYTPYGAARQLWNSQAQRVVISGPAETGKTLAALHKLDASCWQYPGAQWVIVRKTYSSMPGSVLQTYEKVLGEDSSVEVLGGTRPYLYKYPNGSKVWVCGLDNPNKALSSERDGIYVNQGEELDVNDIETLATRCTGRAGNTPFPQFIIDCNPSEPMHHLKKWGDAHPEDFLESRHIDNPTLFDPKTGLITEQGKRTMKTLSQLTGFRRGRLYLGLWVAAEGMVYEDSYDPKHNLKTWKELGWAGPIPPLSWRRIWVIDFGYTNPFCWQAYAIDHDGRLYRYREVYFSQRLVSDHVSTILRRSLSDARPSVILADHDAEDRATFTKQNIFCLECDRSIKSEEFPLHSNHTTFRFNLKTKAAFKAISPGVQAVAERFKVAGDGKARLVYVRDALIERDQRLEDAHKPQCTEEEIEGYIYPKDVSGRPVKEIPVDKDNHGMDCTRYVVAYVDEINKRKGGKSIADNSRSRYQVM